MSEVSTAGFLQRANSKQFRYVESLYSVALGLKASAKSRPEELIKLDEWFQNKLPTLLATRLKAKDEHLTHEELVSIIKWKMARGKFRPKLKELVTMNSPRLVMAETRKALRALGKNKDLPTVLAYLCNLKGIGPSTASAILTAARPETFAFMADECLEAVPEIEGIDQTVGEYLEMMKFLNTACTRLSLEDKDSGASAWTPHRVELTLWTHNVLLMNQPELLSNIPTGGISNGPAVANIEALNEDSSGSGLSFEPNTETTENGPAAVANIEALNEDSSGSGLSFEPNTEIRDDHEQGNKILDDVDSSSLDSADGPNNNNARVVVVEDPDAANSSGIEDFAGNNTHGNLPDGPPLAKKIKTL